MDEFIHEPRIAYFSMEIALRNEIKTYTGGLGVLAGDTMRSAADLRLPLVAVSLVSRAGHFRQALDPSAGQVEQPAPWEPRQWMRALDAKIAVSIEGRPVWIGAWLYVLESQLGGRAPVILLDTALDENAPQDREITHYLYGGDSRYRLKQEIVLGVGGVRMLQALGFEIRQFHMNEGHSAMLGLELLRRYSYPAADVQPGEPPYDLPRVRALCSFTTHTPVEAGHDRFPYPLVEPLLGGMVDLSVLKHLAGDEDLNMTRLALNLSEFVNGVAKRHAELSTRMFPGYHVQAITNGVHPYTWTAGPFRQLYDAHLPGWCHEPELLVRSESCLPDAKVWEAHVACKRELLDAVRALTRTALDPALPTIGFARRMTSYKRPDLLFTDIGRLAAIAARRPFQVLLAGKAHPLDAEGKALIRQLLAHARELAGRVPVVYLPDYDLALARLMVAGVDVWLNTPLPPFEASGTSGMKAAFNGVPSLSVLDGWWIEGCIEGVTGWAVGAPDASSDAGPLYEKLEQVVLPLYDVGAPAPWIRLMKGAISKTAPYFNSHRMMRRYATEAYIR
ncbi:alpha-glucan family phosphorylase [Ramlibacter sp.]|uniref:alpha-glucan family phosphorylase n=1 Tax=Ramlibacter sp. TaxID=1917967 RepID=UPI002C4E9824|nr:alpha-glucan family phosphorylase [Ramlibacter sp.]HWI83672.1 alpha-glucan family phosphorylase [Ramlibacter sp.]